MRAASSQRVPKDDDHGSEDQAMTSVLWCLRPQHPPSQHSLTSTFALSCVLVSGAGALAGDTQEGESSCTPSSSSPSASGFFAPPLLEVSTCARVCWRRGGGQLHEVGGGGKKVSVFLSFQNEEHAHPRDQTSMFTRTRTRTLTRTQIHTHTHTHSTLDG